MPTTLPETFAQYRPLICRVVRQTAPGADGRELVQAAYLRLYARLPKYDPSRGTVAAYLAQETRWAVLAELKAAREYARRLVWPDQHPAPGEDQPMERIPDPGPSPAQAAALADDRARLRQLLRSLPDDDRALVVSISARTPARVLAARRGVTIQAVTNRRRKLLARLRQQLEP